MSTLAGRVATRFAKLFPTPEALKQYLVEHPAADRSKHRVDKSDAAAKPPEKKPADKPKAKKKFTAYKATSKDAVEKGRAKAKDTKWSRPSLKEEGVEVNRTADSLGIPREKMMKAWKAAKVEPLNEKEWSHLENTDSFDTDTFEKADAKAQEYDRDIGWTIARLGETLPSPIVLFRKGKPPYLVGGNTRLMVSRALGVKPSVLSLRI